MPSSRDEISALATGVLVEADGPQGSVFTIAGPYEITGGTGVYEGATGSGVIVGSGAGDEAGTITVFLDGVLTFEEPPPCPADLNGDGSVGFADLQELLQAWGDCPAKGDCPADIDLDDSVGFGDLTELLNAWGPCPE